MKSIARYGVIFTMVFLFNAAARSQQNMKLSSPEFANNGDIPKKFTCEGKDINPTLVIEDMPENTKSLALIVDDPDAPVKTWVHWVVFDIQPTSKIEENSVPGIQGINDFCPPSGAHRYFFKVYALDQLLNLPEGTDKYTLEKALEGHVLAQAELIGLYRRSGR
ncbi:MAG: YbhB/YbcL family Raf kinase inhibitor-like protein [Candidatus Omnitrophica bacterium]|nr:YbhB/YbcL family Raf kinase inhibitor-like protein [Candidatus Omnitrophota bacterium]